jgi:hypothetical protein
MNISNLRWRACPPCDAPDAIPPLSSSVDPSLPFKAIYRLTPERTTGDMAAVLKRVFTALSEHSHHRMYVTTCPVVHTTLACERPPSLSGDDTSVYPDSLTPMSAGVRMYVASYDLCYVNPSLNAKMR